MSEDATGSPDGYGGAGHPEGMAPEQADPAYEQAADPAYDPAAQAAYEQAADPAYQQAAEAGYEQAAGYEMTPGQEAAVTVEGSEQQVPEPQPEERPKKRKIDLKSRLSGVRATGGLGGGSASERPSDPLSFPPPPATGSVPAPALPGLAPSSPMVSSPFAPPEVEKKPTAQQQTIKVEMGEEVHAARKKSRKLTILVAALVALIFGGLGFGMGNTYASGKFKRQAREGAGKVAAAAEEANKTVSEMSDALRKAEESLVNEEFPKELEEYLKTTAVGFQAPDSVTKGLPSTAFHLLLEYTNGVEKLNKQKDKVRGLLGATEKQIATYFKTRKKKNINFAVVIGTQGKEKKLVAEFLMLAKPFPEEGAWPETFSVKKGKKEQKVTLFDPKGKLTGGETPAAFVVTPKTSEQYTKGAQIALQVRAAILSMKEMIDGKDHPRPELQIDGVLKDGKDLIDALKKIQQAN